jgi:glycosyltransferase involved in cell wall biosynthesis
MQPIFTIIVPNFNYDKYIRTCLFSIQSQSFESFEVLICDGGSSDSSISIIKSFCDDRRFKLFSMHDTGQANALNSAIRHATGEYICYLNSDDFFITSSALKQAYDYFCDYPLFDIITMKGYFASDSGSVTKPIDYSRKSFFNLYNLDRRVALLQPASFWKRYIHENGLYFRENLKTNFDTVFFYECHKRGFKFLFKDSYIAAYRWHNENISNSFYQTKINNTIAYMRLKNDRMSLILLRAIKCLVSLAHLASPLLSRIVYAASRYTLNLISYLTRGSIASL